MESGFLAAVVIQIDSEPLLGGGWQPQWWIKSNEKTKRHFSVRRFINKAEADGFSRESAVKHLRHLKSLAKPTQNTLLKSHPSEPSLFSILLTSKPKRTSNYAKFLRSKK